MLIDINTKKLFPESLQGVVSDITAVNPRKLGKG
jgi:hypothetical protein